MHFSPAVILGLRAVQGVFSVVVLGLTAFLVDRYNGPWRTGYSPGDVNMMLFTSIWTLLAVAYLLLVPTRFPKFAHKFMIAGVEFVTMVFWFASWVSVAVRWGDWYRIYTPRSGDSFYSAGVAAIVFAAFTWLAFVATTVLSALHISRSSRNDSSPPREMTGV